MAGPLKKILYFFSASLRKIRKKITEKIVLIQDVKCEPVTVGYTTQEKCHKWPRLADYKISTKSFMARVRCSKLPADKLPGWYSTQTQNFSLKERSQCLSHPDRSILVGIGFISGFYQRFGSGLREAYLRIVLLKNVLLIFEVKKNKIKLNAFLS